MFDILGNQISTAYDINGNIVYELDPVLLSDIPSYSREDVTNALNYVDGLGDGYANYIVVTDTHYPTNCGNSSKICNYMSGSGKFDKMIHLGDWLEGAIGGDGWNAMIAADFCHHKQWIITQGNHDSGLYPFSVATPYFEAAGVNYVSHSYKNGFYYDNTTHKIRFIGLHHMLYASSVIRAEVESFISSRPSGYKWCFISHYPMMVNAEWARADCMTEDAETWLMGLIDTYPGFVGLLSGHLHLDEYTLANTGTTNFHHMTLDADNLRVGTQGTNTEQVVTIVSINPTTENVKFYRIGRSAVYESKQWEWSGFTQ